MQPTRQRRLLLTAITLTVSLVLGVVICEGLLRLFFRDGGRTTLGGPGGQNFEYTYAGPGRLRGPMESGPKAPGVRRIMVMGDSITWGDGVREWTDTYPMRLLDHINTAEHGYDMAVHAYDGKEIDNHLATISGAIDRTDPDIVIYQWFINDVEIDRSNRPRSVRSWRTLPWHDRLQVSSYLYYVLDFEADRLIPAPGRSYVQYMEQDYAPGTHGWKLFTRAFHAWAEYALAYADRTILLVYPPVPIDALQDLRNRTAVLADGQVLSFGPDELEHPAGRLETVESGPAIVGIPEARVDIAVTRPLVLAHGAYTAAVHLQAPAEGTNMTAHVTVTVGDERVGDAELAPNGDGHAWHMIAVPFHVDQRLATDVRVHVTSGGAPLAVDRIDLPMHYGIEVVDVAPQLRAMRTAASYFDAHPNAATHDVVAQALARQIRSIAGY
jgi:hypothetical protein